MCERGALEDAVFALEVTDTVIWKIDLESGDASIVRGSAESLFNVPEGTYGDAELFFDGAVHPDDQLDVKQLYADVMRGRADEFNIEFRTHPDHGNVQWVKSHGRVHADGPDRHLTGIATDITEQKHREQELEEKNEQLEELVSVLSHDFRNPLNVAQGHLELAQEDCNSTHLAAAKQAHERLEELVDSVLEGVRDGHSIMRKGQSVGQKESVEIASLAEKSWANVETNEASLVVETNHTVYADCEQLTRLLENLFRNAVEHGGRDVTVTVGGLDSRSGFYVADDGPGIPEDDHETVFEKGYSTTEDGIGFGLHIVQEIVAAHDWTITLTHSDTGGARFEISERPT